MTDTGWQPIETAPHETDVLVYDGYRIVVANLHYIRADDALVGMLDWDANGAVMGRPTRWRPLPPPPETEGE